MADNAKAGLRQLMPSLFNGIATAIAAAAGFIGLLHQTGYLGNHRRMRAGLEARAPLHPREVDRTGQLAAAEVPAVPAIPASAGEDHPGRRRAQASEPERRVWRDMGSNCHLIVQTGHELTVTSYAAETGKVKTVGSGTVKGRTISVRMNSANPLSLEADLILSDDGRELSGMIKGVKGAHVARWRFLGPSCS